MDIYKSARRAFTLDQEMNPLGANPTIPNPQNLANPTNGMMLISGYTGSAVLGMIVHIAGVTGATFAQNFVLRTGEPVVFPFQIYGTASSGSTTYKTAVVGLY